MTCLRVGATLCAHRADTPPAVNACGDFDFRDPQNSFAARSRKDDSHDLANLLRGSRLGAFGFSVRRGGRFHRRELEARFRRRGLSNCRDLEDERDDIGVDDRRALMATKTGKQDHNLAPSL